MRSNKSYVKETLAFVNSVRRAYGLDPRPDLVPGKQSGSNCPVSRSLRGDHFMLANPYTCSGEVGCDALIHAGPVTNRQKIRQTRAVRRFVRAFDTGRLPEYHV